MFRAAYRSSSGALTLFAASGLHKHVATGRSQVCVGLDYGRSPHVCFLTFNKLLHSAVHCHLHMPAYIYVTLSNFSAN